MRISKKKVIFAGAGLLVVIIVGLTLLSRSKLKNTPAVKVAEDEAIPVEIQEIRRTTMTETISAVGTVEAWHDVTLSAEASGKVVEICANEGDRVKREDVIIKLDDELRCLAAVQAKAQVLMAKANFQKAKRDLKRSEDLFGTEDISESQIELARLQAETAEAGLKSAEVALKMALRQLADTEIKSPIDGKVAVRYVDVGELVAPGTPIATVVDLSRVKAKIGVSEQEIAKIKTGQKAYLSVDAYPDERFEGEVSNVGLKADLQTRSFPIEIEVPSNSGEKLKPGMIARVKVDVKTYANVLLIPQDAVLDESEEKVVYVVRSDKAAKRSLLLGRRWDERVVVERGLEAGDRLVVAGQEKLSEGTRVVIGH